MPKNDDGREVLTYSLPYFMKGIEDSIEVKIVYTSGRVRSWLNDIYRLEGEFKKEMDDLSDVETEIGAIRHRLKSPFLGGSEEVLKKEEKVKLSNEMKILKEKKAHHEKNASTIGNEMLNKQIDCVRRLLDDNGYSDRGGIYEKLFNEDFWLDHMERDAMSKFIFECVIKDQKKKDVKAS